MTGDVAVTHYPSLSNFNGALPASGFAHPLQQTVDNIEYGLSVIEDHILLVESEDGTAEAILADLAERGYRLTHEVSGLQGLAVARDGGFGLIIIDRTLPELDGLSVVETLRAEGHTVPVLFLSAVDDAEERVRGLKAGGDDYMTIPFVRSELAARIEALLRRPTLRRETTLRVGPLELDLIERRARRKTREIELLPREFKLLEYLMRHPSRAATRDTLLEEVWNYRFSSHSNLVDVHIGKLRRKIDAAGETPLIHSIRGVGFVLRAPE